MSNHSYSTYSTLLRGALLARIATNPTSTRTFEEEEKMQKEARQSIGEQNRAAFQKQFFNNTKHNEKQAVHSVQQSLAMGKRR